MTPFWIFLITFPFGAFMLFIVGRQAFAKPEPEYDWDNILEEASDLPDDDVVQITDIDPDNPHKPAGGKPHTPRVTSGGPLPIGRIAVAKVPESEVNRSGDASEKKKDSEPVVLSTAEKLRKLAAEKDREIRSGRRPVVRSIDS